MKIMNYEEDLNNMKDFLKGKRNILGAYCYGMVMYKGKKNYHLILVTDNIKRYKPEFMSLDECTNSDDALIAMTLAENDYIVDVDKKNECIFDYTVVSDETFKNSLENWTNLFIADIFQKPILSVKTTTELDNYISIDRRNALLTSLLIIGKSNVSFLEIMQEIFAYKEYNNIFKEECDESNIQLGETYSYVDKNYYQLMSIYGINPYFTLDNDDSVQIDLDKVSEDIVKLPLDLMLYIDALNQGLINENDIREEMSQNYTENLLSINNMFLPLDTSLIGLLKSISRSQREENLQKKYIR